MLLPRYTFSLFLLLSLLAAKVFAVPPGTLSSTDMQMWEKMDTDQHRIHLMSGLQFHLHTHNAPMPLDIGDFTTQAFRLARGASRYVGEHTPFPNVWGDNPKTVYFYSLIHPGDRPALRLGLEDGLLATVLWKKEGAKPAEIIYMNYLEGAHGVDWRMESLDTILQRLR